MKRYRLFIVAVGGLLAVLIGFLVANLGEIQRMPRKSLSELRIFTRPPLVHSGPYRFFFSATMASNSGSPWSEAKSGSPAMSSSR